MDRLDPVLNYIAEHYKEPISLDEIADIACLQTGYFCRFILRKKWALLFWNIRMNIVFLLSTKI